MRIGLDAMGGDKGPQEVIAGALDAQAHLDDNDRIVLVGDQELIEGYLAEAEDRSRIEVQHASEAVAMDESPVEAMRGKPDNSIIVMTEMQRDGKIDACISAGNTGACVAAAQMKLSRLAGVQRPGIAVVAPTGRGPVAICDVGANVNCRPMHLYQYAVMTSLYLKAVCGIENPRVGLLSVGGEASKGNELVKKAGDLLRDDQAVNFIGNVEGSDILRGVCDVMICEGFVGNVVLKLIEGLGEGIVKELLKQFQVLMPDQLGNILQAMGKISEQYDSNNYGGAPLLGVDGIWMICHGASSSKGIMNAVIAAKEFVSQEVNQHITELLTRD